MPLPKRYIYSDGETDNSTFTEEGLKKFPNQLRQEFESYIPFGHLKIFCPECPFGITKMQEMFHHILVKHKKKHQCKNFVSYIAENKPVNHCLMSFDTEEARFKHEKTCEFNMRYVSYIFYLLFPS